MHRVSGVGMAVIAIFAIALPATAEAAKDPQVIHADSFGVSTPVRDLGPAAAIGSGQSHARVNPLAGQANAAVRATRNRDSAPSDPLAARGASNARTPAPGLVFDGTSNPFGCGGCSPPDTNGDVGPNNYIQMVNATKVAIFNKAGTLLTPAFNLSTLFSGSCGAGNAGDPVVVYDEMPTAGC